LSLSLVSWCGRMKYGVIVPFFNAFELTQKCVGSLRAFSRDYQIIFVDNGSDLETKNKVREILEPNDSLITNGKNLGFAKAVNQGLRVVETEFVCILNNDVEVCNGWLEVLEKWFQQLGGFIGYAGGNVSVDKIGVNRVGQTTPGEVDYLGMSCMFSSKYNFDFVGLVSEDYGLVYCEDTDYGMRILQKGLRSFIVPVPIFHHGGKTASLLDKEMLAQLQGKNVQRFFMRWGEFLRGRGERL